VLIFCLLLLFIVLPALAAWALNGLGAQMMFRRPLRPGAPIVYRVQETSSCPGPDAVDVYPSEHGEFYDYLAKKYWRVEEVLEDGSIVALTPLMEHQYVSPNDPNLRRANLVERVRYAARFPTPFYR
jgi:hypothetical protein